MAKELERQIEHAQANSPRPELQGTRASGSRRKKKGLVNVEAPAAGQAPPESSTLYVEVMQELDRVKSELRKLQREVKSAREAKAKAEAERDAETPTPRSMTTMSSESRAAHGSVTHEAGGGASEERVVAELAEAGGLGKGAQARTTRARGKGIRPGTSDTEGTTFATASSSDVGHRDAEVMAMVRATEETDLAAGNNGESAAALTIARHEEARGDASLQAAEAELNSARVELASIREEGHRFATSIERTRKETVKVAEEISRLKEQEKRAGAQVQQLNERLLRARARLDAATAADERAEAVLAEMSLALKQLGEEAEAAGKEKALTELENRCVVEGAESVGAEIAAAERRVRQAVRELEAARAAEAAADAELRAALDGAMLARAGAASSPGSGNVTVPRFEYEYLTGRGEVVGAIAEKKVAAAEAWVEALRAGEKEMVMRADAIEREIGGRRQEEAEDAAEYETTHASRGPDKAGRASSATPARKITGRMHRSPSTSVARKPRSRKALISTCMKLIARKRQGRN